jgi:L-serine/L-threonine ammonia-lyase
MEGPPDAIVCCVGGGGLIGGIFEGLRTVSPTQPNQDWKDGITRLKTQRVNEVVAVVAVETHGAASFYAAHTTGKHVGIEKIDTIAKSLGATKISKLTFDLSRQHQGHVSSMLVSDAQAANATWRFASSDPLSGKLTGVDDHRLMVEVAGGATLSLVYEGLLKEAIPTLSKDSTLVLVICGGSSVTIESLIALKKKYKDT